jgi:hypothetical protein
LEQNRLVPLDTPVTYRICITGVLENGVAERYWGMTSAPVEQTDQPGQTVLIGEVADQAALVGRQPWLASLTRSTTLGTLLCPSNVYFPIQIPT